jgi:hypothetical protein
LRLLAAAACTSDDSRYALEGKMPTTTRCFLVAMSLRRASATGFSAPARPGRSMLVLSESSSETPRVAEGLEALDVVVFAVEGVVLQLEVSGVQDGAARRVDGQGRRVGDGMGHADGLDHVVTELEALTGLRLVQVDAGKAGKLPQPFADEPQGVGGGVNGDGDLPQEVRQGADVVFVTVGDHHAEELVGAVFQVVEDGVDDVHPAVLVREGDATVDHHDPVGGLDGHAVHPYLAEATEGDDANVRHALPLNPRWWASRTKRETRAAAATGALSYPPAPGWGQASSRAAPGALTVRAAA